MMTHASSACPSRTSFSVLVEMCSRGSAGRTSRSCVTSSGSRTAALIREPRIRVCGSPAPCGPQAGDDARHREDEADEPEDRHDEQDDPRQTQASEEEWTENEQE